MATAPHSPASPPCPEQVAPRAVRVARLTARVVLGLFILWQVFFLFAYNTVDAIRDNAGYLREQRGGNGLTWKTITFLSRVTQTTIGLRLKEILEEWLDAPSDTERKLTPFGRCLERTLKVTRAYARLTGQEQGWGLFAPDVVSWGGFPAVELRWDTDLIDDQLLKAFESNVEHSRKVNKAMRWLGWTTSDDRKALTPEVIYSENEPRDWQRFIRIGKFRVRRIEQAFETRLEKHPLQLELEAREGGEGLLGLVYRLWLEKRRRATLDEWDNNIDSRVRKEWRAMLVYMKWKVREFMSEHPGLPAPTQVILRHRAWRARAPYSRAPFEWVFHSDLPLIRWLPWKGEEAIEIYRPSQKRYGQW